MHAGGQAVVVREGDELRAPAVAHGAMRLELAFVGQLMHERRDRGGGDAHNLGEFHLRHRTELMDRFQQVGAIRFTKRTLRAQLLL